MKDFKGTPGPWFINDDDVTFNHVAGDFYHQVSAGSGYLRSDNKTGFGLMGSMNIHDANLIAAAPDLLEALQGLIHADCHSVRNSTVHIEALKNATAAISKALGEE